MKNLGPVQKTVLGAQFLFVVFGATVLVPLLVDHLHKKGDQSHIIKVSGRLSVLSLFYFVPKILSPASPRPGMMYFLSFKS